MIQRHRERHTLKEAYVKGRGVGLSLPLQEIAFTWSQGEPVCALGPHVGDDGRMWRFWSTQIAARHFAAAAVRTGGGRATLKIFPVSGRRRLRAGG